MACERARPDRGGSAGHVTVCASGSPPPAGWRSRWRWSSSASRACAPSPSGDAGARAGSSAVIDARRGEAFAAAYGVGDGGVLSELVPARALAPEELAGIVGQAEAVGGESLAPWLAFGDGAIRFRGHLELAGVVVPADSSPLHVVGARAVCDLGHVPRRWPARGDRAGLPAPAGCRDRSGGRLSPGGPRTVTELSAAQLGASHSPPIEIRRLIYTDLPQVIGIERRVFPTPWSLAMFVLRAIQAVGDLPRGRVRAALGRISDLLPLRHGLARDERGGGHRSPAHGPGLGAAGRCYARVNDKDARSPSRCAAPTTSPSICTSERASAPPACAAATTRTTARMPS